MSQPDGPIDYSVRYILPFVEEMQQFHCAGNFMVSFDVVSFFINEPLIESIDLTFDVISEIQQVKANKLKKCFYHYLTNLFYI